MIFFRLFIIAFNVGIVSFLVYRMVMVIKEPIEKSRKQLVLIGGAMLLIVPFAILFTFMGASVQYFLVYPVVVSLFLYFTR